MGVARSKKGATTMTDTTTNAAPATGKKKPPYVAYTVIDLGEGKDSRWRELAAASGHKDGRGFAVLPDASPFHGRIPLRVPDPKYPADQPGRVARRARNPQGARP